MRQRYRIFVCPEDKCPAMGKGGDSVCPTHNKTMVPIVVRKEDAQDQAIRTEHSAKRVAEAAAKVGESAGKVGDPFGMADMFRGMADDIERGTFRPSPDADIEDDDEEDEDD